MTHDLTALPSLSPVIRLVFILQEPIIPELTTLSASSQRGIFDLITSSRSPYPSHEYRPIYTRTSKPPVSVNYDLQIINLAFAAAYKGCLKSKI
ncbi:MAG: hypothetical protein ACI88H_000667 [Cocleimonas sp.]|jgi:hypothetical protein